MSILSIAALSIILICFIIIKLKLIGQTETGFDTFGHMYFAREIKEQHTGPFDGIDLRVPGSTKFRNVLLLNWLFSKLPHSCSSRVHPFINILMDTAFALAMIPIAMGVGFSWQFGVAACVVYYSTPLWFSGFALGPRVLTFTPRLISELATNLFFVCTVFSWDAPYWLPLISGALIASFVLLSSKFSSQAIVFLTLVFSFLGQVWLPVGALLCGIVMSLVITRGSYLSSLMTQAKHLKWYFLKNIKGRMNISARNELNRLFLHWNESASLFSNIKKNTMAIASKNGYTAVIFKLPALILLSILFVASLLVADDKSSPQFMIPIYSALIIYFLTNLNVLLFLGESERYLSHVAIFIVFAFVDLVFKFELFSLLFFSVAYGMIFLLYEWRNGKEVMGVNDAELESASEVMDYLKACPAQRTVLLYPFHAAGGTWRVLYETDHNVIFQASLDEKHGTMFEEKFSTNYPFVNLDYLEEMNRVLGADVLIIENSTDPMWTVPKGWTQVPTHGNSYSIYEFSES